MSKINSVSVTIQYDYPGYRLYPKFQEEQSKFKLTIDKKRNIVIMQRKFNSSRVNS